MNVCAFSTLSKRVTLLMLALAVFIPLQVGAQVSLGPNNPSSYSNMEYFGMQNDWVGLSNIVSSNNQYASFTFDQDTESDYLIASGFGFDVPTGATVSSVKLEVEWHASSTAVKDLSILLTRGTGNDNKATNTSLPTSDTNGYTEYVWDASSWGTLSVTDIESSDFGVMIALSATEKSGTVTAYVDHIRMTVYYEGPPTVTLTSGGVSCTGDACPQDFGDCGDGRANSGGTYNIGIAFSSSVTGFIAGDITVVNGSVSNLSGAGASYTATITSNCTDCLVEVSVGANVVTEGNSAAGPLIIPWGENYFVLCDVQCGSSIAVPAGFSIVKQSDGLPLSFPVGYGTQAIRILKGTSRVVDFSVTFDSGFANCEFLSVDQENQTSYFHGFQSLTTIAGASYALYVPKVAGHTAVRTCSSKTSLGCISTDTWSFLADDQGVITSTNGGFDTTGITVVVADGYWKISGLTGTSGEGEGSGTPTGDGDPIPFFPLWAYPVILAAGAWFLQREGVWGRGNA